MDRGQSTNPHLVHLAFAHVDMPILFCWSVQTDVSLNPQKSGSKSNNAVLQARHHDLIKFGMPSFFLVFASRIPKSQTEFSCCHQKKADAWGDHRRGTSGLCDVFSSQHRDRHCCSNSLFPQSPHLRRDSVVVDTGENWILLIVTQQLCPGVYYSFLDDACWPPDKRQRIVALRDTSTSCSLMMATSSSTVIKEEGHPACTQDLKGWHPGCNITS